MMTQIQANLKIFDLGDCPLNKNKIIIIILYLKKRKINSFIIFSYIKNNLFIKEKYNIFFYIFLIKIN